jgi:hypothetical protein
MQNILVIFLIGSLNMMVAANTVLGQTGACCVDGECVGSMYEVECFNLGGNWYGGVDCDAGYECPPPDYEGIIYNNGGPLDDYGSPVSQYDPYYPFAGSSADDFTLDQDYNLYGVEAWTTHWLGAEGQGPNLYEGVSVAIYYNYSAENNHPDGYFSDYHGEPVGNIVHSELVPMENIIFHEDDNCTGDLWHLYIPVTTVYLEPDSLYWLEIVYVMSVEDGGMVGSQISINNSGNRAMFYGDYWMWLVIEGNRGLCEGAPPEHSMTDLAFRLYGEPLHPCGHYVVGDYDGSGLFNVADIVDSYSMLKTGEPAYPELLCQCLPDGGDFWYVRFDVNNSCEMNVADIVDGYSKLKTGSPELVPCELCPPAPGR